MHCSSTFGARTSHGKTRTHKIHHSPNLGEATTFPLIVYFMPLHEAHIQMAFCFETPKWESRLPKLGLPQLCGAITLCVNLWSGWDLKQYCTPHWELSNNMSYATFTLGNQGDPWLLMVGSQFDNLTPNFSFDHNLCFRCPNESCEPI